MNKQNHIGESLNEIQTTPRKEQIETWELAWLACAIEGEGFLTVVKTYNKSTTNYTPRIGVANSGRKFMERCKHLITLITGKEPNINQHRDAKRKAHNKEMYRIEINQFSSVLKLADAILPYMCDKKEQTVLVRDLAKLAIGKRGVGIPAEIREQFYHSARALNRSAKLFSVETECSAPVYTG